MWVIYHNLAKTDNLTNEYLLLICKCLKYQEYSEKLCTTYGNKVYRFWLG